MGAARFAAAAGLGAVGALNFEELSLAPRKVGEFPGSSGMFFKDTVEVMSVPDPKVDGVVLHLSSYKRSIASRISEGDMFTDSSQAAITVAATKPPVLCAPMSMTKAGEDMFSESRNLFFKAIRVRRIVDTENSCLVYVAYSTRMTAEEDPVAARQGYRTSICSVPFQPAAPDSEK